MALQTTHDEPQDSWRERWFSWRDRTLANSRFQRFAAAFWLTRPIARRRTRELFDLVAGFVYSQVLFACVRVKLIEILAEGTQSLDALTRRLPLPRDNAERLIRAAASLRLAERRGDGYGLGVLGAAMRGNPGIAAMVEHHAMLYADLADPVALLRGDKLSTELRDYWAYAQPRIASTFSADEIAGYSSLMAVSQAFIANEVLAAYPLARHRCLLDVGGGAGAFLAAAAQRAPHLRLMLFDLPPVAAIARETLGAAGVSERAAVSAGSFVTDSLPVGADIVSLVRVLHDHDDRTVRTILARTRAALPPGGTILIAEPMAETPGAEPAGDAYFGFYLLAMGSGRPRTVDELSAMLREAGFGGVRLHATRTPLLTRVLTAVVNR